MSDAPDKPFSIVLPVDNGKFLPPKFALPFDTAWRPCDPPNLDPKLYTALISLGFEVWNAGNKYVPDYAVIGTINARTQTDRAAVAAWNDATLKDNILITDRRNGTLIALHAAFSELVAVMSWFARSPGNDSSVLCWDRADGNQGFYVEPMDPSNIVALDADGREVPPDEPHVTASYRTDMHPNALMAHGE